MELGSKIAAGFPTALPAFYKGFITSLLYRIGGKCQNSKYYATGKK
jgi:hypothetical protein